MPPSAGEPAGEDGAARRGLAWVLGALAVPDFRRFFLGQAISQLGDRLVPVALTFAVLGQTHSVTDLSIVLTTQSVAQLAFILAGGVIADRVPRRDLMRWSDAAPMRRALQASTCFILAPLALAIGMPAAAVAVMAAAGGTGLIIFSSLYDTSIQQNAARVARIGSTMGPSASRKRHRSHRISRVGECPGLNAGAIVARIQRAVHEFGSGPPADDLALIVFRGL
jgi:hypothetical protein